MVKQNIPLSDAKYDKLRHHIIEYIKKEGIRFDSSGKAISHKGFEGKLKYSPRQREGLYNTLLFVKYCIRRRIRKDFDSVIAITGENGTGKSMLAIYISLLADKRYRMHKNCMYFPDEKEFEETFHTLNKFEVLHVDEAARSLHRHNWSNALQQKINLLYDVEARKKQICTILILPRFTDLNEKFRNFRVRYWVHVMSRGWAIIQEKDQDPHAGEDPWHMREYYKLKEKKIMGRRLTVEEQIDVEEKVCQKNFVGTIWFPDMIPTLKKEYLTQLRVAKKRQKKKELDEDKGTKKELLNQAKEKLKQINGVNLLLQKGATKKEVSEILGASIHTIAEMIKRHELPKHSEVVLQDVIIAWPSFHKLVI